MIFQSLTKNNLFVFTIMKGSVILTRCVSNEAVSFVLAIYLLHIILSVIFKEVVSIIACAAWLVRNK